MRHLLLLCVALILSRPLMAIEEPAFAVESRSGDLEFRRYAPFVVARTTLPAEMERTEAANAAFFILFKYIQGANTAQASIAMTAPVLQDKGTKIAMTAPVIQESGSDGWRVAFVLPAEFNMETAPVPTDERVKLELVPERRVAALQYSGRWTEANVTRHAEQLLQSVKDAGAVATGPVETAYYNAPYVTPFMRRNEVLVTVDAAP